MDAAVLPDREGSVSWASHPRRNRARTFATAVGLATLSSLVIAHPASAEDQPKSPATARVHGGVVDIDWADTPTARSYAVIDDPAHKVVWSGSESAARIRVEAADYTDLLVVASDGRAYQPVVQVLASNPAGKSGLKPLVAVTTAQGTEVTWQHTAGVGTYQLAGEGVRRSLTAGKAADALSARTDTVLGERGTVEILGNAPAQASGTKSDKSPTTYRYGVEITPPAVQVDRLAPRARAGTAVPAPAPQIVRSVTDYEAYIPDKLIDAPEDPFGVTCEGDIWGTDYWYKGDDRGPGHESGKYRTRAALWTYWNDPDLDVSSKDIQPTVRYIREDDEWHRDEERTASGEDFTIDQGKNDGEVARSTIHHDVANPFCNSATSITYTSGQTLRQDGGHFFSGYHDKMPNHQLWRTDYYSEDDNSRKETEVFHHKLVSPYCLADPNPFPYCDDTYYEYLKS
ncbi:hypothetical protein ACXZ65_17190 [Streptomyces aculeolatus]